MYPYVYIDIYLCKNRERGERVFIYHTYCGNPSTWSILNPVCALGQPVAGTILVLHFNVLQCSTSPFPEANKDTIVMTFPLLPDCLTTILCS